MTMVSFSRNGTTPIFPHLFVLTYEKNRLGFVKLLPEKALKTILLYSSLYVFLATAAASRKLFLSDFKLVLLTFIKSFSFFLTHNKDHLLVFKQYYFE